MQRTAFLCLTASGVGPLCPSSEECLDIHLGSPFSANLGDGHGWVNQTIELRQDYGSSDLGTCLETLIGGNHFRYDTYTTATAQRDWL